jgi:methylated-DNA-protein-cysteine methyltransferase-like protein
VPAGFRPCVVEVIARLRPGEVVSYGDVAAEAGYPGAARGVGAILAHATEDLPWWRVVTATGRLVPGNEAEHRRLLRAEGVTVRGDRAGGMGGRARDGRRSSHTLQPMDPQTSPWASRRR